MTEKKITVQVTCKDEATTEKYKVLAEKMAKDTDFAERIKICKSDRDIYDLYAEKGYTDLNFEDFITQLGTDLEQLRGQMNKFELSEEELDAVVGGFSFFSMFTTAISVIPIAGPVISGVAKAIKAGVEGKGVEAIVLDVAIGLGTAMVDAVVVIGTAGMGTAATTAFKVGMGVFNGATSQLTV